ncbi:MAG: hypothetical protein V4617_15110 [Gemmatimonadota bacterium]
MLREREQLQAAFFSNYAFHDGKLLERAWQEHEASLEDAPGDASFNLGAVIAAARAHAQALHESKSKL